MSILHLVYRGAGALAAAFVAAIAVLVVAQIVARLVGIPLAGADDFAAWSMAAATFLALPLTMLHGEHIRISLIFQFTPKSMARTSEFIAELIGFALACWMAWASVKFVISSYQLGDVSQGEMTFPLWIPQFTMAAGLVLLAAACAERVIGVVSGHPEQPASDEIANVE